MNQNEEIDAENRARVEALRAACQGEPLLSEDGTVEVPESTLELFRVDDTEDFLRLVRRALDLMIDTDYKAAISSALGYEFWGYESTGETLTRRRENFLAREASLSESTGRRAISNRTLIRHEQEGAAQLADLMTKIRWGEPDVPDTREQIDLLLSRVRDLETVVTGLSSFVSMVIGQVDRGVQLNTEELSRIINTSLLRNDDVALKMHKDADMRIMERVIDMQNHAHYVHEELDG